MKTRIITAIAAICVLIPCLIWSDTPLFPIACGIVALIALFEITGCIGIRKKWFLSVTTFLYGVVISAIVTYYFITVKASPIPYSIFSSEKLTTLKLILGGNNLMPLFLHSAMYSTTFAVLSVTLVKSAAIYSGL